MTARNQVQTIDRAIPPVSMRPDLACRPDDNPLFYPDDDDTPQQRRAAERQAVALCRRCPHQTDCLIWSIQSKQQYGIWGGLNAYARDKLRTALKATTPTAS